MTRNYKDAWLSERWFCAQWLVLGVLISSALLFAAHWEADRQGYVRLNDFRGDIANLSRISESIIIDRLQDYDNCLLVLRDSYAAKPQRLTDTIRLLRSGPLADNDVLVLLNDREGYITYTDAPNGIIGAYMGTSDYFRFFADGAKDGFHVSAPVFGRVTKRHTVPISRPIYDSQGRFDGVVGLSVMQDSIANFGHRLQLSGNTAVTVIYNNGAVVSRSRDFVKVQGTKVSKEFLEQLLKGNEGVFSSPSPIDGVVKDIAYRHISGTPLIVYVEVSTESVIRETLRQHTILMSAASITSLIIFALIAVYLKSRSISLCLIDSIRKSKDREYETLTQASLDGFCLLDRSGRFQDTNSTLCVTLGYTRQELLAMNISDLELTQSKSQIAVEIKSIIENGNNRFQSRLQCKDGGLIDVEICLQYAHKLEERIFAFVRDITENKRFEDDQKKLQLQLNQAQKMESVGRLAGGVAHDFNNKLTVIIGYVDLIIMDIGADNKILGNLKEIRRAADSSADLTRQLLAFARKETVSPKVLDLNETINGMLNMLRRLIGEDINLTWLPGAKLWPVNIDPSQIDQILANLCVNSRDAINGIGTISIQTEVATFDAEYCNNHAGVAAGDYVTLVVSDTGCGMDVEMQSIIFEPFFTTKGVGQGTGLGLASVYGAVTQNNGYINVYSEPGLGTTFRIYLPRCFCENNEVHKDHMGQSIVWGNETILLVEDDLSILNVTTMLLRNIGYNVLAASSPSDAMQLAREHIGDIDLLLTDVIMPEMNGRDLARNILTLYPNARSLFMSGYPIDIIANQGVLDAEVNFIRKPFSTINLADKLREVLEGLIAMDEVHNGTLFVPLNAK